MSGTPCDFLSFHWSLSYKKTLKDTFVGKAHGCTKSLIFKEATETCVLEEAESYTSEPLQAAFSDVMPGTPFQWPCATLFDPQLAAPRLGSFCPIEILLQLWTDVVFSELFGRSGSRNTFFGIRPRSG